MVHDEEESMNLGWDIWNDPPEVQAAIRARVDASYRRALEHARERVPLQLDYALRRRVRSIYRALGRPRRNGNGGPVYVRNGTLQRVPRLLMHLPSLQTREIAQAINAYRRSCITLGSESDPSVE